MTSADRPRLARVEQRLEALERREQRKERNTRIERATEQAVTARTPHEHALALEELQTAYSG